MMVICSSVVSIVMNFLNNADMINEEDKESADFFFHFTPELRHLINIMNYKFMPFFCMESLEYLNFPELQIKAMAYPMICFCDIPLSRQKEHRVKFGSYGIGLSKDWGINNRLTPVVYSHDNSMTSLSMKLLIDLAKILKPNLTEQNYHNFNMAVSILFCYFKPYKGKMYLKAEKKFSDNISCFYDEKEWRYFPLELDLLSMSLTLERYENESIRESCNLKIQEKNHLLFNLADIEYLFLKERSEKEEFLNAISEKFSKEELKVIENKIQYN